MTVMLMYLIQIKQNWNEPPDWKTLATFTDKEQAERELDRLTRSGNEVRLVNDAENINDKEKAGEKNDR